MANNKKYLPEYHNLITTLLRFITFLFSLTIILIVYTYFYSVEKVSGLVLTLIVVYPGIILTKYVCKKIKVGDRDTSYVVKKIEVGDKDTSTNSNKIIVSPRSFLPEGWYRLSLSLWFILPIIVGFLFALEDEDLGFSIGLLFFLLHWPSIYLFKWIKDGFNK